MNPDPLQSKALQFFPVCLRRVFITEYILDSFFLQVFILCTLLTSLASGGAAMGTAVLDAVLKLPGRKEGSFCIYWNCP